MAGVHKEIGMTIADLGVTHGQTFESQFINHAARVGRRVDASKAAIKDDVRLRTNKLQNHPRQFAITYEQVRAATEELVRNVVHVEQTQQVREAFVLLDAQQVRRSTDAQRSQVG